MSSSQPIRFGVPSLSPRAVPSCASSRAVLLAGLAFSAGCGAGTAGIVASSGGSSGGSDPALNSFTVQSAKVSPCALLLDANQPVRVALFFDAGSGEQPMELIGVSANEIELSAGPNAPIEWDFEVQLGGQYRPDVRLVVRQGGALVSGGEQNVGVGNDPPELSLEPVEPEVEGIVPIRFRLEDSSSDLVDVRVHYHIEGDPPQAWSLARPGGHVGQEPPDPTIVGIAAPETGVDRVFFWDTDQDLPQLERDVRLRFTPIDPAVAGAAAESGVFRVDNNAVPIVQLQNDAVILNPDERRGIPIPFRVIDEEEDQIEVIFQWRQEDQDFPPLPSDMEELDAILADPARRRAHRICTPYPCYARGRIVTVDDEHVRLPELAASESWIVPSGIPGKTLELLRPSSIPQPVASSWSVNPLDAPIAALPLGDGLTAIVLDGAGPSRLREIELATGAVVRAIASIGPELPTAMTFERGTEKSVLIALDDAGIWRIVRVDLESGIATELVVSDGSEPAPVRGIASLGEHSAVVTAGSALLSCEWSDPSAPRIGSILGDLGTPWGVAVDPLQPNQLYVSERDANRVLAIELETHSGLPVVVHSAPAQAGTLAAPESLALEADGSRLLVETDAPGGQRRIEGLNLGGADGNVSFLVSEPTIPPVSGLACGRDGLRLVCVPGANELFVAGGVQQCRPVDKCVLSNQEVAVQIPFDPAPMPSQPWRFAPQDARGSAQGVATRFIWDCSDAPPTAPVYLRATARDNELGPAADAAASKPLMSGLSVAPLVVSDPTTMDSPQSLATADLDGDGDLDFVTANASSANLTVFFQTSLGSFASQPLVLADPSLQFPQSVAAADLDSDGDTDLVCAPYGRNGPTVFLQTSSGTFIASPIAGASVSGYANAIAAADFDADFDQDLVTTNGDHIAIYFQDGGGFGATPLILGGSSTTQGCKSVASADLNADGYLDVVSANEFSSNLTIFFQEPPGIFGSAPLVLGDASLTSRPTSVLATDLDSDGDTDVVATNGGDLGSSVQDNLTIFLQTSPGAFDLQPLVLGGLSITINPEAVTAADLDSDGDLDLVSANHGDLSFGDLTVFFQVVPGSFETEPLVLAVPSVTGQPSSVDAEDLDGDGDVDLLVADEAFDNVSVFLQDSPGHFLTDAIVLGSSLVTPSPRAVAPADFDRDGTIDLVSANEGGNLTLYYQTLSGGFQPQPLVIGNPSQTGGPASVAAVDLDGNGYVDVVSANSASDNLTAFFQSPSGGFNSDPIVVGGPAHTKNPQRIVAADVDGDGLQDLISANQDGDDLTVFMQSSIGVFADTPLVLGGGGITDGPIFLVAEDIDADGDLDVASSNLAASNLTVFFQEAGGGFGSSSLTLGGPSSTKDPLSLAEADLDGDGDLDLVSANRGAFSLTVFFQVSPGNFNQQPLVLEAFPVISPASVATNDMDGDGDVDLVCAGDYPNPPLTIFMQTAPGQFVPRKYYHLASWASENPRSLVAGDLDKDGDADFAFVNVDGSFLTVVLGGR